MPSTTPQKGKRQTFIRLIARINSKVFVVKASRVHGTRYTLDKWEDPLTTKLKGHKYYLRKATVRSQQNIARCNLGLYKTKILMRQRIS